MTKPIAFATDAEWPQLTPTDQMAAAALAELGAEVQPARWDLPNDWAQYRAVVIRSPWDYHVRPSEYSAWLDGLEAAGVEVWNPITIQRWNMHKGYLAELESKGVRIVPSLWLKQGQPIPYAQLQQRGWERAVLKPLVSADSYKTWIIDDQQAWDTHQLEILAEMDGVAQAFMPEVQTIGEHSFIFFDGEFSHCVLKTPKAGDFRTQVGYGATAHEVQPEPGWVAQAQQVLAVLDQRLAYARVDGILRDGSFYLMELELIEPHLFLECSPGSAQRFARALLACLEG
ncbi:MAG: hypothetical protein KIS88_09605 [Anaerolineales bacterium]|nr:hypothetical protein [Anaerolineales bacterium]